MNGTIDVVAPVGPAIQWTKRVLFQPFDIAKWFTIGFCAWLAYLGQGGGGGGPHFNVPGRGRGDLQGLKTFLLENLYWIVPVGLAVLFFALVVGLLFTWLSSRGLFMFLDCVARDKAVVAEPWRAYGRQGDSLFLFRLVVGFAGLFTMLPVGAVMAVCILRWIDLQHPTGGLLLVLASTVLLLLLLLLIFSVVEKLTRDFVVPLMYLRRCKILEGWRQFGRIAGPHIGSIILYLLFHLVLSLAMGMLVLFVILVTCCVAGCVLILPYLGTVLLLPLLVFQRSYSALYWAQYGPDCDVFHPAA